ncbi:MAG: N-acetylmuramoyl-L-alanine amidase [Bacteroidetes bacterium]|nr:N-acetylmuramoyl-L-alanine amidase [Bacteroidota bacterium]MBK9672777.1 N-acetylmuramoyl-L-alanine amidase [Bacteroidota bacterium]MBK9800891.1 N-acetylmuramoyl-L-alanine amidase [Bacteroidota bacterium]MBP6412036.1 N-acetylmuramoyl-L-alanine amidase [Bacteroidia bacterium]
MPALAKLDLKKIVQVKFPDAQYFKEEQVKKQIVIHHTVSGPDAVTVFEGWASNPDRVATAFVISGNGTIVQGFGSKYWAHHLGLKRPNNTALNKASIGIEVCNWGGLTFKDGKYYSAFKREVPAANLVDYGKKFRGFRFFHKYTPAQIESLRQLLVFLADKYSISKTYNADMWDISSAALSGKNGIYTHVSYREDKSDMHPQEELVGMLKGLQQS